MYRCSALDDKPEQLQALATFNTGFNTVNKLYEFKNFFSFIGALTAPELLTLEIATTTDILLLIFPVLPTGFLFGCISQKELNKK